MNEREKKRGKTFMTKILHRKEEKLCNSNEILFFLFTLLYNSNEIRVYK